MKMMKKMKMLMITEGITSVTGASLLPVGCVWEGSAHQVVSGRHRHVIIAGEFPEAGNP